MEQRFWVAKPIYNQISIGFSPKADYWTVAGDFAPADCFSVGFPHYEFTNARMVICGERPPVSGLMENKTILSGLRLNYEEAIQLADLFEKERLASIADKRPAYYQRILTWFKGRL